MPHISPVSQDEASQETKDVYADFARRMLFALPPNFIKTQGHSATVARATWDLVRGMLVSGQIPRWIKEMMFVADLKGTQLSLLRGGASCLLPDAGSPS